MTEQERKQFINEYCRNVGNIKIKCDDCKFVEDCVDYGWQECKKFTPKPSEPLTNEEYIHSLNTEQLAEEIYGFVWCCNELWQRLCCSGDGTDKESDLKIVREWLKQPHNGE